MPAQQFDPHERPATSYNPGPPGRPASIVTGYLVAASAWILLSGAAADRLVGHDYRQYAAFEQAKGLAFVAVTGLVLWFLLRRYTNQLQQAHEKARRMARFAELSPNPIVEFGMDGTVAAANAAAHRAANALGRSVEDLLPPAAREHVQGCLATGGNVPSVLHTVGGRSWRWAFFPADGSRTAFGYGYDRTPEARLELQVQHAARMESVGRLAAGVAHDLNNNLMAISGLRALVTMQVPEGSPAREDLDGIREQLDHAQELVKRLLLVARVRTTAESVARVDIAAALRSIAATVRHVLPHHVQLEVDLPPGPIPVDIDVRELEQALLNLATNAVDAMPEGGVLRLALQETGDSRVCIEVTDTGEGIPPEILPRIFDPFFTTKEETKGTGLGLASVYAFATQNGGGVEVESEPGAGSCFSLQLPRVCQVA
jgi:signal transduction histidine kinase